MGLDVVCRFSLVNCKTAANQHYMGHEDIRDVSLVGVQATVYRHYMGLESIRRFSLVNSQRNRMSDWCNWPIGLLR